VVTVVDPDAEIKKKLIERAYHIAEMLGLALWCEDEAGPYQTIPYRSLDSKWTKRHVKQDLNAKIYFKALE